MNIAVSGICGCQIGGHGRSPYTVRCNQAPRLAAGELPLAAPYVYKKQTQAKSVRVGGGKNVCRIVSIEVAFNKAGDVIGPIFSGDLHVPARVLSRGTVLREMSGSGVAERDSAEVCTHDVTRIH